MFSFGKKTVIGLDIGSSQVKAVELEPHGSSYRLRGFGFALLVVPVTVALIGPQAGIGLVTAVGIVLPAVMAWELRRHIDHDVLEFISDFRQTALLRHIDFRTVGLSLPPISPSH